MGRRRNRRVAGRCPLCPGNVTRLQLSFRGKFAEGVWRRPFASASGIAPRGTQSAPDVSLVSRQTGDEQHIDKNVRRGYSGAEIIAGRYSWSSVLDNNTHRSRTTVFRHCGATLFLVAAGYSGCPGTGHVLRRQRGKPSPAGQFSSETHERPAESPFSHRHALSAAQKAISVRPTPWTTSSGEPIVLVTRPVAGNSDACSSKNVDRHVRPRP